VWFRNTWSWGREEPEKKPSMGVQDDNLIKSKHHSLGDRYVLLSPSPGVGPSGEDVQPELIFTENDTNYELLYEGKNESTHVKDAFHRHIVDHEKGVINPAKVGTKAAAWFTFNEGGGVNPGECAGMYP
jgi:hypothetical protein